jgi:aspartate kinase
MHSVEKIGGTSMNDYAVLRNNIFFNPNLESPYQRVFVVSAYGGITNQLLEHKKSGEPGIYALFADDSGDSESWRKALYALRDAMHAKNQELFSTEESLQEANDFINARLKDTELCLNDLHRLCKHGHFSLEMHLKTVREMLASLGEAHSAWNTAKLLQGEGLNAIFVDLTGWNTENHLDLDERIIESLGQIDFSNTLPICTGYAHSRDGLMSTFDRGYSEMTFSRVAVLTRANEAIIHKEYHLSSADPKLVGTQNAVPIGRTNYDVADQLANLGMEAIHPKAAKGLRQLEIPLRVKNTFEPEHSGTLITGDYVSGKPRVEIIAGCSGVYAIELFDQDMAGNICDYDSAIISTIKRFRAHIISKSVNANTITHYVSTNLKNLKRIRTALEEQFGDAEIDQKKVAVVSAIGSDMKVPGMLAKAVAALAEQDISVLATHQNMRQVDMQFIVHEDHYAKAVKSLHSALVEIHNHGSAICLAS